MSLPAKAITAALLLTSLAVAQPGVPGGQAEGIRERMSTLRLLSDAERAVATMELVQTIPELSSVQEKLVLASDLVGFATEGDNGIDTLQALADTLADAIRQAPKRSDLTGPAYAALAHLARYEGVAVTLDDQPYRAALKRLERADRRIQKAKFSLKDLTGKKWSLRNLHGKVVLVNFWATWCLPCLKELPELEALYNRFQSQGLVVLAISDEDAAMLRKYLARYPYSFPILHDPARRTGKNYGVESVPRTFVYDREGRLVAMAMDQRNESQLLEMLAKAGLKQ